MPASTTLSGEPCWNFGRICRQSGTTGKLVADAQHAAVAVEHGCTLVTTDSDFSRFPDHR
ncbi:MAG: PIN domain-containing protein [Acidimicrobiia bacterium]|nr:PIN domain-containing protein [Acidimicrobiia bacterium]